MSTSAVDTATTQHQLLNHASRSWLPCGRLGAGSFGHVHLALNLLDRSLFAIKSCPSSSPSSPHLLSLLNELHILQSLRSPFILRCLGAHFDDSSAPSLFLEYMDGGSLADLLRRSGGKLRDETLVARYTRAILQGLNYLHQNGIVHCDIKSHNILLGSAGVKIADFGAARRLGGVDSSDGKMEGMLRGTPLYMAPEVVQGVEQGPPSDVWSLGCTVVEMLQGRPPWGHVGSVAALFLKLGSSEEYPPLPELVSAEAKDFLQLCLQRDPKARPTAAELLQHPFVCGKLHQLQGELKYIGAEPENCGSPRSTLVKFPPITGDEWGISDGCISIASSMPNVGMPSTEALLSGAGRSKFKSEEISAGEWITVKHCTSAGRREDRQSPPFRLRQLTNSESAPETRRASEVSLDCVAFLIRNRRRRTVG